MRVKKCFAIFSLMMIMCLSVLPTFTSAAVVNLLEGKTGVMEKTGQKYKNMTDGDMTTFDSLLSPNSVIFDLEDIYIIDKYVVNDGVNSTNLASFYVQYYDSDRNLIKKYSNISSAEKVEGIRYVGIKYDYLYAMQIKDFKVYGSTDKVTNITNLEGHSDVNKISFSWENPDSSKFVGVKVYRDNQYLATVDKPLNSYIVDGLKADTPYVFKFTSLDSNGFETVGVTKTFRTSIDPKTIPPGPVSSLTAQPSDKTVKLIWKKPKDEDLAGFKIFQDGKRIAEIGLEEEFTVKNLEPLKEYSFGVVAVDKDKNDSSSVNLTVKTLEEKDDEPPHVPSNVFAKPSNGALIASWDKVSDKDFAGYNVYVDGKKINSNLISSTNFTIKNLENNRKYKIQVQAVDRSGNASELSAPAYGTPDENTIPIIESHYSLQDVSDGVGVMFTQFWTVLAFAVGIPLAFYIIYKLKLTVLP
ncbi:fibronectin type III domain-containing protein [Bacillus mycoides]|uniref:fibronectin type III domain-containing protein n=1 Tax=Bacillus mycoides TaxID=1405 RepID=UPI003D1DB0C9